MATFGRDLVTGTGGGSGRGPGRPRKNRDMGGGNYYDMPSQTNVGPQVDQRGGVNGSNSPLAEWRAAFDDYMTNVPNVVAQFQEALRAYIAGGGQGQAPSLNLQQPPMPNVGAMMPQGGGGGAPPTGKYINALNPPSAPGQGQAGFSFNSNTSAPPQISINGQPQNPQNGGFAPGTAQALQQQQMLLANGVPGGGYASPLSPGMQQGMQQMGGMGGISPQLLQMLMGMGGRR